jgi:hypothetical protein
MVVMVAALVMTVTGRDTAFTMLGTFCSMLGYSQEAALLVMLEGHTDVKLLCNTRDTIQHLEE